MGLGETEDTYLSSDFSCTMFEMQVSSRWESQVWKPGEVMRGNYDIPWIRIS